MEQLEKEKYLKLVEELSPNSHIVKDSLKAFLVGGLICTLGQVIINTLINFNIPKDDAGAYTSIILIFIGVLVTGVGLYSKLGKFSGAGSLIPITGFANAVASPAIEFKKEGYIFGVGSKMFTIAGPVIVYGTSTSIIIGSIYYFIK
jgi:stage V sporulation protein AC